MSAPKVSEEHFIEICRAAGSKKEAARWIGVSPKSVRERVQSVEKRRGIVLFPPQRKFSVESGARKLESVVDGVVLVGSDAHYWARATTAHRAFVAFCAEMNPAIVVMNGDAFDGASISRHPKIGYQEKSPSVADELDFCKERLGEIRDASPEARHYWTAGNHDMRFEAALASRAPEYENVKGHHLKDHFPGWASAWSVWVNDQVVIKHRMKGGVHAAYNNAVKSGKSVVTGHLHSAKITPVTDYTGTRWGVDCGCLADPYDEQFVHYTEDNAVDWRSGFCVLTFRGGQMLPPELVLKWTEESVTFRGEIIEV